MNETKNAALWTGLNFFSIQNSFKNDIQCLASHNSKIRKKSSKFIFLGQQGQQVILYFSRPFLEVLVYSFHQKQVLLYYFCCPFVKEKVIIGH